MLETMSAEKKETHEEKPVVKTPSTSLLSRETSVGFASNASIKVAASRRLQKLHLNRSSTLKRHIAFVDKLKAIASEKEWKLTDLDDTIAEEIETFLATRLRHQYHMCRCVDRQATIIECNVADETCLITYNDSKKKRRIKIKSNTIINNVANKEYLVGENVTIKKPSICPVQLDMYLTKAHVHPAMSPIHFICSYALVKSLLTFMSIVNNKNKDAFSYLLELEDIHGKTPIFFAIHGLDYSSNQQQDHTQQNVKPIIARDKCIARMKLVKLLLDHNARLLHRDRYGKTIYDYLIAKPDMYSYLLLKTVSAISNRISRNSVIKVKTKSYELMYNHFCEKYKIENLKHEKGRRTYNDAQDIVKKYLCKEYKLINEWSKHLKADHVGRTNIRTECLNAMKASTLLNDKLDILCEILLEESFFGDREHVVHFFKELKNMLNRYTNALGITISDSEILNAVSNDKFLRIYYCTKPGKKFVDNKIVEFQSSNNALALSYEYEVVVNNFMDDDFLTDVVTLFKKDTMEFKLRFRDIEDAISDIFSQTAYGHYQPAANEPSTKDTATIHEESIEKKDDIMDLLKSKKIDSMDVLEKVCNWMISLANILIPKEMIVDNMYKNFRASILREIQNILVDVLLYSSLITLNMDIVEKENILKQFLDKAYAIYSERSNLYKWEKIELKLLQFQNDSVYISQKDMYVVRFVIVEQNASKYDTKRSERHLIHDTFKYSVVTHHVKNLFYKFVDASLQEHCTRSQVKIENRDVSHIKRRASERQRAHNGRILKHFGSSFEITHSESRHVSLSVGSGEERRMSAVAKNAINDQEMVLIDNTVDTGDVDVLTESSTDYTKPRWRVVCRQELANIKKEREEHHMWNDNIKFRDSIRRTEKIILKKYKNEQKLDLKLLECKRSLIETVNQYIINVLEPALVSGLGNVICRATCRPDLLSDFDKSRVGIDGFNDSDADKMLQEVFVMDKQRNMYRVGRNDIINILYMAPVVKQWNIIFHPKLLKILNSLLIEACKFQQGPHGIARAIVKILLRKGADPNTSDENGDTALFLASNSHPIHKSDICSLLIKAGAAVTVSILSNFIGNLSRAGEKQNTKKSNDIKNHFKYVVFYGAYYGTLTEDVLALMNSVSLLGDDGRISHNLLKDIQSVPDGRNFLPMHYAAMHGNVEIIDLLYCYGGKDCINKQFDANITQKVNGKKVFQVFHSKPVSITTLLKSDDNVDTIYGFTPLALAVQNNHPSAVRKLISLGAKPFPFDDETDYESAKNNYLCPYWLALGLFRATEDPSLRYNKSINKLNTTVVILKHPNDSPTTHFQKVYADVKLDDINKQSLKRAFEHIQGYTLEEEVAENIDSEALFSITEALTRKANKERRESVKARMGRHRRSVLVEAIKHDFVQFSTDQEMRDRQLQMLVVKKFRSNYVERRGKNCEKWRNTPLFTFGDNLKALRIDNTSNDRLIEFMDIDLTEKNKLNASNLHLIEKEKRKEILNIMNRHHKVKNMLKRYSRNLFIWPCIVYFLLLIFCIITVPSFFWESDYAFEVNSYIISELQNGMKNLKESNYDVFGSQIGFESVNELGPWISDKMFKTHLPKLYKNNKVDRIGSIRICSFVAGGWKVQSPFQSKKGKANETIMKTDFNRKSYNERDWQRAYFVTEVKVIEPSKIGDYCQKTLEALTYQRYCLDINYDNSNPTIATETIAHLSNCTWFQHDMVRTEIILHFYSKQANLLSQIVQTFSKEPTGLISCQFDAESIKQLTWDINSGVVAWFNTILEIIFCLYLCSEFVAMIKAFVVAGKYSQMLIRQKYKIAGRSALLRTYEEECKLHNRGDLPVQRPTCCKIIPFPCKLSQKMYSDFYISIGVNYNVLLSIISSPNENYVSLSISQSIIIISGILSTINYFWLAYLKHNLMLELEKSGNTGGVDVALEVFEQANTVKSLMIVLLYTLWFRLFDVLKQEPSLGPFVRALFQTIVSYEIVMFFLIFMLGLVPVTLSIHLVLGTRVERVSTIYKTLRTMLMFSIVGEHEQPDFWMHGTLPDSHNLILMFFLVMIILIFLNLLIAIVTDVWQSYDREKIYMKAVNDEMREAVSNYVEGIDYGNSSTANAILRRVESMTLDRSRSIDS
eukprot:g9186.t1